MSRMTMVQFGMVLFAVCLLTQVASDNSTVLTSGGNSTAQPNVTTNMATGTYSSSANTTSSPTGAGMSVHPGAFTLLLPVTMAAPFLLLCYC